MSNMRRKFTLIAMVLIVVLGLGIANVIYAQGPGDDDDTPLPCELHPMWQGENCPFADQENWQPGMMMGMMGQEGCWMLDQAQSDTATMPFGGRGMMGGMGQRGGMMGMGSMMHNMNHMNSDTMPYPGMMNGAMGMWGAGVGNCNFEWDGEIPAEPTSAEIGDAENGALLFAQNVCIACHDTTRNVTYVGPSLVGVGERAATREEGMSAYSYLYQSIVDPNAHVVEGFAQSIMPPMFGAHLTEAQINDLIAYLLSL